MAATRKPTREYYALHRHLYLLFIPLAAIGIATYVVGAEEESAPSGLGGSLSERHTGGFIDIFSGKDLGGWKGLPGYWFAKDGVITGRQTKENSKQTFLTFTRFRVSDFELRIKYKFASTTGNAGVQFRSELIDPKTYRVGGYQADMDASREFDGSIYDEAGVAGGRRTMSNRGEKTTWNSENKRQSDKFGNGAVLKETIKINDWNSLVLVAKGSHITYSINGHVMTELIDDSPNALKDGILALQLHEGFTMQVQFKDLQIRLLDAKK
jgi:Domain of Unknown Function (DUF1080)